MCVPLWKAEPGYSGRGYFIEGSSLTILNFQGGISAVSENPSDPGWLLVCPLGFLLGRLFRTSSHGSHRSDFLFDGRG